MTSTAAAKTASKLPHPVGIPDQIAEVKDDFADLKLYLTEDNEWIGPAPATTEARHHVKGRVIKAMDAGLRFDNAWMEEFVFCSGLDSDDEAESPLDEPEPAGDNFDDLKVDMTGDGAYIGPIPANKEERERLRARVFEAMEAGLIFSYYYLEENVL